MEQAWTNDEQQHEKHYKLNKWKTRVKGKRQTNETIRYKTSMKQNTKKQTKKNNKHKLTKTIGKGTWNKWNKIETVTHIYITRFYIKQLVIYINK